MRDSTKNFLTATGAAIGFAAAAVAAALPLAHASVPSPLQPIHEASPPPSGAPAPVSGGSVPPPPSWRFATQATVAAGHPHALVRVRDGRMFSGSRNNFAQPGHGTEGTTTRTVQLQDVAGSAHLRSIAAGSNQTLMLADGGAVRCAGSKVLPQGGRGDCNGETSLGVEAGPGFDAEP